jgi:hypothetical protein
MKKLCVIVPLVAVLAACGSSTSTDTTVATSTTVPQTTTVPATGEPLEIDVTVGDDSDPDRIEIVDLGSSVTITLVNPNSADEYHLHGYDISTKKMAPGVPATISFTATKAGTFELESHITENVLVVLEIS